MKIMIIRLLTPIFAVLLGLGCSPKVYVVDRHTVMEEEAAGEWPDFERKLLESSTESAPTAFEKTENSSRKNRLYNVLNGEWVPRGDAKTAAK